MARNNGYNVKVTQRTRENIEGEAEERRHEEYGGFKFGAAFYGWLVATGIGALLTSIATAAGVAVALSKLENGASDELLQFTDGAPVGLAGGIVLLLIAALSYYAGGYVAGRLARFDGARQGVGVWVISILAVILAALAGALLGAKYNVLQQMNLPNIPVDAGKLTAGGIITLIALLAVTLIAALLGGKAGERYHRKINRAGM